MDIVVVVVSLIIGGIITWFVSRYFYKRGTNDFAEMMNSLDKIASPKYSSKNNVGSRHTDATTSHNKDEAEQTEEYTYPRVANVINEVETAFNKYGTRESADTGGFTISELQQLSERVGKIADLLKRYAMWRTHTGD